MKLLTFTQQDGQSVTIKADDIKDVKEFPAGQCWVSMEDGTFYQLQDDVEKVRKAWEASQS